MDILKKLREYTSFCSNYRSDTEQCRTGCVKTGVGKGDKCPFDYDANTQMKCPCYK